MDPCVIIPTHNEAGTIVECVSRALDALPELTVLVVDDGSSDGTVERVRSLDDDRIRLLGRDGKHGLGDAYRTGFRMMLAEGFDVLFEMDADLSHDPADLPRLLDATEGAGLVIGSRYVDGGRIEDWSTSRRALSRWGNRYARTLLRLPVADATSGFRCFHREALEAIDLATVGSDGYAFQVEMAWRAWRAGVDIAEVPIAFVERGVGESKMSLRIAFEAFRAIPGWAVSGGPVRLAEPALDPSPTATETAPPSG